MAHAVAASGPYGLMAEFDSAQALLEAAHRVRKAGYTRADAFSPFPIHGLAEALGFKDRRLSKIVFAGALTGTLAGYGLEYWTQVIAYPMNIGGRPYHAWVSFIPPAFETTRRSVRNSRTRSASSSWETRWCCRCRCPWPRPSASCSRSASMPTPRPGDIG